MFAHTYRSTLQKMFPDKKLPSALFYYRLLSFYYQFISHPSQSVVLFPFDPSRSEQYLRRAMRQTVDSLSYMDVLIRKIVLISIDVIVIYLCALFMDNIAAIMMTIGSHIGYTMALDNVLPPRWVNEKFLWPVYGKPDPSEYADLPKLEEAYAHRMWPDKRDRAYVTWWNRFILKTMISEGCDFQSYKKFLSGEQFSWDERDMLSLKLREINRFMLSELSDSCMTVFLMIAFPCAYFLSDLPGMESEGIILVLYAVTNVLIPVVLKRMNFMQFYDWVMSVGIYKKEVQKIPTILRGNSPDLKGIHPDG